MDLRIIDIHCHIFPPLAGACGFPDVETHRLHQQRAMHVHGNQPYRRARDHALVSERALWKAEDISPAGRREARFGADRNGRFRWMTDAEPTYVQFLPPAMTDLSVTAETMIASMDYAGIATAVLQNDHIYGNLAEDFADAARNFPGRFIGTVQVEEAWAYRDEEIARLHDQTKRLGMKALYFTTTGLFRSGYRPLHDDRIYDPFWAEVQALDLPIFWVQSARGPVGSYEDEMRCMANIMARFPKLRHILVHGIPTAIYCDEHDRIALPGIVTELFRSGQVWGELLYPIAWGGRHDYPYARAGLHFRQLLDAFGHSRFAWGSDMPNVERYCTHRQSLTYALDHFDFLTEADHRAIFHDNAAALFGLEAQPA